jgi:ankyrin repeat protein
MIQFINLLTTKKLKSIIIATHIFIYHIIQPAQQMEPNIDTDLFNAIISDDPATVHEIIKSNPSINLNAIYNRTSLLCCAARRAQFEIVKLLVDNGAAVNDKSLDECFQYDTIYAAVTKYLSECIYGEHEPEKSYKCQQCYNIIKYLLEHGANCDSVGPLNKTLLMEACGYSGGDRGYQFVINIVQLLLEHGANRDLVNDNGVTAEQIAMQRSNLEVAEYIHNYQQIDTKGCYE